MNFKEILELIDKVADRGIAVVEVERAGTRVRIEGKNATPQVIHSIVSDARSEGAALPATPLTAGAPAQTQQAPAQPESDAGLHIVTSPIVGTFYRSPNPESEPFINVGDRVSKGQVLCIIEAMKLMNEIECDADGVVDKIYPQNGQPIEYGERLFALKV
ncbi:MAG TPA: acetyl-CoA carboxylase biotin carboxyl carrier protein [Thermoanaerobaculia bacterium]|nr:acetyl-CoA carboxylase biotin carboxyl carrier protein [Thermoanaerobaculia bacterium]